jgi:hypothetical protein
MNLGPLQKARMAQQSRSSWTVLFLKGYALLAAEIPELRRAYVKFPRPHLYEYPVSVASIKSPETCSIAELEASIQTARSRPVLEIKEFRRALKIARAPAPVRWLLMWLGLNIGRKRGRFFGTFQLSVYSGLGAESLNPLTPLTTLLNYGPINEDGLVTVRIHYDHRVMDGANVARALERFERILNGEVAGEVKSLAQSGAVPSPAASGTTI